MCEPAHSIVQYPDQDSYDGPFQGGEGMLQKSLGKGFGWAKKVGKWLHLSKFGLGHYEAQSLNGRSRLYLPSPTLYEGLWWLREFKYDGGFRGPGSIQFNAAKQYHESSVMTNMSTFRRFLETSMRKSSNAVFATEYVFRLLQSVLTPQGGNQLLRKFRNVFGKNMVLRLVVGNHREESIKMVMGFTRKRHLFLPHFADDNSLWVPGGRDGG